MTLPAGKDYLAFKARAMTPGQLRIIWIAALLMALDGFDVMASSFAAPGIASEWHIDRLALGIVLSAELAGMAVGSIAMGPLADRIGRRPVNLLCLLAMALGMVGAVWSPDVGALAGWRLLTGFGVGGMLAMLNTIVAEFASDRRKESAVAFMITGYPFGAVIGGLLAAILLAHFSWRSIFLTGALLTGGSFILAVRYLPETVPFLLKSDRAGAELQVQRILAGIGHDAGERRIGASSESSARLDPIDRVAFRRNVVLLSLAYFTHMVNFYFILKWSPKIVVDLGFSPSLASTVLISANIGGIVGVALVGWLASRVPVSRLLIWFLLASAVAVAGFGASGARLPILCLLAFFTNLCTNGAVAAFYATATSIFPTSLRTTGVGLMIGIGRGGSVVSPILAGFLLQRALPLVLVSGLIGLGSILAIVALSFRQRLVPGDMPAWAA